MRIKVIACAIVAAVGSATVWSADYTVSTVDFPGATGTVVFGIDNQGKIVGGYGGTGEFVGSRGFIADGGVFTPVGATMPCRPNGRCLTAARQVNDRGEIVGSFSADVDFPGLFVQFGNESPTIVQPPGYPNTSVRLGGLNERNVLAGCYSTDQGDQIFTQSGTQPLVTIQLPVDNVVEACAAGINNWNQLVGFYGTSDGQAHGFLKSGPLLRNLDVPAAWGTMTDPVAINDFGLVTGTYVTASGEMHGFVWDHGQFTSIEFPGAAIALVAEPEAINDRGEIVGLYAVPATVYPFYEVKVFVYRNGQISKLTLPGDGAAQVVNINDRGEIVGTYTPSGCGTTCTEVHGFLAVPASSSPMTRACH